jgi:(2Fe-2S) ferredoxin
MGHFVAAKCSAPPSSMPSTALDSTMSVTGPIRYCHLTIPRVEQIVHQHLAQQTIVSEFLHPTSLRTLPPSE